ncbi:MAG TPA: DUF6687 family protein, partial [Pyrinomonadaceae bacterium]|nr:DUF6687 family protein [Pyrinomonadaceae bacterium]
RTPALFNSRGTNSKLETRNSKLFHLQSAIEGFPMRFEFYHDGLEGVPKLSVDGLVPNSVHLTHWQGNETPAELRADTSTEIALNLVASPRRAELTRGVGLVTNNHFDTDGVLSVWTVLAGERALAHREMLVAAAEAGDFSEFTTPQAVRANICIQGGDDPLAGEGVGSPLARHLAGGDVSDEARAYELVLPEVERVLTRTDEYEPLWRGAWAATEAALESFARGASRVEEDAGAGLSVVTLAAGLFGPGGFDPARHAVPYTAVSRHARGLLYLVAVPMRGGWGYRLDYPYYSWAVTVVRPRVERRDFAPLVERLNRAETGRGRWKLDGGELTSAVKFVGDGGHLAASRLEPDAVAAELRGAAVSSFGFRVSS